MTDNARMKYMIDQAAIRRGRGKRSNALMCGLSDTVAPWGLRGGRFVGSPGRGNSNAFHRGRLYHNKCSAQAERCPERCKPQRNQTPRGVALLVVVA